MKFKHSIILVAFSIIGFACQAPLPEPTPVVDREAPTRVTVEAPTATPRPSVTPLPTFTATPTGQPLPQLPPTATPDAGFYRNPELGFSFNHPISWQIEETGGNLPAAVVYDDDDPVQMFVGGEPVEAGTSLDEYVVTLAQTFGISTTVELIDQIPTTLASGTDATRFQFRWAEPDADVETGQFQAEGLATIANGQGFALIMSGRPEIISTRLQTFEAIAASFSLDQPELFGISRENGLVLLTERPLTLDPARSGQGAGGIAAHLYSGMVRIGADLQPQPELADSWEVDETGTIYTFRLRDNLTFHSGESLDASSVIASWERARQEGGLTAQAIFAGIEGFEATDAQTIVVTLTDPYPGFLFRAAQPAMMVMSPADLERLAGGDPLTRPDGSGPFSLRRYEPDEVILLDRFDAYHSPAELANIIYLPFGETGMSAYESGLLDMAGVAPFNLARVQDPADPLAGDLVTIDRLCTEMLVFDTSRPPFDNLLNRQIFAQAVDQQILSEVVLSGARPEADLFLPPQMPGRGSFPVGLEATDVASLTLPDETLILTLASDGPIDAVATAVIDGWRERLGVSIEIETVPSVDYEQLLVDGELTGHLFLREWCAFGSDPADMLDLLFHSQSPLNIGQYASAEFDNLVDAARSEGDPAARIAAYEAADQLLIADAPAVPLTYGRSQLLKRPYIAGFTPAPIDRLWQTTVTLDREGE